MSPPKFSSRESTSVSKAPSKRGTRVQRSVSGGCAYYKQSGVARSSQRQRAVKRGAWRDGAGDGASEDPELVVLDGDEVMLCIRFPLMTMDIRVADFVSLADGAQLNDTVIDFYLNHIVAHLLPDHSTSQIHVLPSLFWYRLRTSTEPLEEFVSDDAVPEALFSQEIRTYVNFWVEEVDLFDADLVVIPVIEQQHWMLAIVSHPSALVETDHQDESLCPSVTLFDSQQREGDSYLIDDVFSTIRRLLQYIHGRRVGGRVRLDVDRLGMVLPLNLPQQNNDVDCGLFVMEYARCFLRNPPVVSGGFDFSVTYPEFRLSSRSEVQQEILSLCVHPRLWAHLTHTTEVSPRELPKSVLDRVMVRKDGVLILYGSQTGQSEAVARMIEDHCVRVGVESRLFVLADCDTKFRIENEPLVVVVVSSTGDGDPPDNAAAFVRFITRRSHSENFLKGTEFALLGLGDSNYSTYQGVPRLIEKHLLRLGARKLVPTGVADDQIGLELGVEPWVRQLFEVVVSRFGLPIDSLQRLFSDVCISTKSKLYTRVTAMNHHQPSTS